MALRIRLVNWYCWGDETLDISSPCSFVLGRNGSGKTSAIRDALEFAYLGTGRLRAMEKGYSSLTKKELAAVAIRNGFDSCEVTVEAAGIRIRRAMTVSPSGDAEQEAWRSTLDAASGRWSDEDPITLKRDQGNPYGDTPDDLVRCMLEPTYFAQLDAARRQEILVLATSDSKIDRAAALEALTRRLEAGSPEDLAAIEDAATWVSDLGFRGAEDAAVEQRREAKRDLAAIGEVEQPDPMFILDRDREPLDLSVSTLADHERALANFRAQHTEAVRLESAGAGAIAGQVAEAEKSLAALVDGAWHPDVLAEKAAVVAAQRKLATLRETPAPIPPDEPLPPTMKGVASKDAIKEVDRVRAVVTGLRQKVLDLEKPAPWAESYKRPKTCPLGPPGTDCGATPARWKEVVARSVEDPTAKAAALDAARGELRAALLTEATAIAARDVAVTAANKARASVDAWVAARGVFERYAAALKAAIEETETRADELDRARDRQMLDRQKLVDGAKLRVSETRAALKMAQDEVHDDAPDVGSLERRIERGERVLKASRAFWGETERYLDAEKRRAAAKVVADRWDSIATELKPDGIETELGGNAREAFLALLAETAPLSGEVLLDDKCAITVKLGPDDFERHPLQLSTSQSLALGAAIQNAICRMAEFPFWIVDAVDTFDAAHRQAWVEVAERVAPHYAAVVGMATITREPPGAPESPWTTLWLNGTVLKLGAPGFEGDND